MKLKTLPLTILLVIIFTGITFSSTVLAKDPEKAVQKRDKNGDGKISLDEWHKTKRKFNLIDSNGDGYIVAEEFAEKWGMPNKSKGVKSKRCQYCEIDGYVPPNEISNAIRQMVGKRGKDKNKDVAVQKSRGVIETYLKPKFINGGSCPEIDSEQWAIDYSNKRPWTALHKGIDIPQPRGTPILAIADGTVVGKFKNKGNRKGVEVVLRHTPGQTSLPFYTYSQYTHLQEMSPLPIGEKVNMGQEIAKTANTGKMGRRIRRDALHFAVFYSQSPYWTNDDIAVMPKDGYFMDPNAFYRLEGPYDSYSLLNLAKDEKNILVPYKALDGSLVPNNTKRIWPYICH